MGRAPREKPPCLAQKLRHVRLGLGYSQGPFLELLGLSGNIRRQDISDFETGKREPPLRILLRYARLVDIPMEHFADDDIELPEKLSVVNPQCAAPKSPTKKRGPKPGR
jgi:transcriptional regulator with XRE-family HTH domain